MVISVDNNGGQGNWLRLFVEVHTLPICVHLFRTATIFLLCKGTLAMTLKRIGGLDEDGQKPRSVAEAKSGELVSVARSKREARRR